MRKILNRLIYNSLLLLSFILIQGCEPGLEIQVETYEQAHNRHDVEKVMSLYTNDISFEIVGSWKKSGKEQVMGLAEWDAVTNSKMIISDIEIHADTAFFRLKEGNDWFRLAGIEFMYYEPCRMVFYNGMIKEIIAEVTEESLKSFQEVWPPIFQWLSEKRNEELSGLMPGGEFVYSTESARKWLSLLREWREKSIQP
jgi:hypothetical protein